MASELVGGISGSKCSTSHTKAFRETMGSQGSHGQAAQTRANQEYARLTIQAVQGNHAGYYSLKSTREREKLVSTSRHPVSVHQTQSNSQVGSNHRRAPVSSPEKSNKFVYPRTITANG